MISIQNLDCIVGLKLTEIEKNHIPEFSASGGPEVILHFENGKEIMIYVDNFGHLHVEGD